MNNPFINYYKEQAGSGIAGFSGVRHQIGHSWFGRFASAALYPLLRLLGKKAVSVGADIASDVILNKKDWKRSTKDRLGETAMDLTQMGVNRAKQFVQTGKGQRRTKKVNKKTSTRKKVMKKKSPKTIKRTKPKPKVSNALARLLKNASNYS